MKRLLLFILLNTLVLVVYAKNRPNDFKRWDKLTSKQLVDMGTRFAEIENKPDSALVCYTIVTGRYDKDMDKNDKYLVYVAYTGKWYVYFFYYFDYSKSYENLQRASEIAKENGNGLQRIYLNFGCMYHTVADQSGDTKSNKQAENFYKMAFNEAVVNKDTVTLNMAILNLCSVCHSLGHLSEIESYMKKYADLSSWIKPVQYAYTILLHKGLLALENKQYKQALELFMKQKQIWTKKVAYSRYIYVANINMAKAYAGMGEMERAMEILFEAERITEQYNIKDAKLEVYKLTADYSLQMGKSHKSEKYRNKYFSLKDSMLNYRQIANVSEQQFLGEIKALDEQIEQIEQQRKIQNIYITVTVTIAFIVIVFLLLLWYNYKKLRKTNKTLYENNIAMLKSEEEERNRRKEYEKMVEEMRKHNKQADEKTKYRSSWLDEDDKQEMESKILDVIESTDEIFSPDFSADRLAELIGINYRYLSQVINERYGVNFNTFINEYRIKEACKRINDIEHYGNQTIESIANGCGFRSRSSFFTTFKKFTGLSPSEYQKIAKKKNLSK